MSSATRLSSLLLAFINVRKPSFCGYEVSRLKDVYLKRSYAKKLNHVPRNLCHSFDT